MSELCQDKQFVDDFLKENREDGLRVFVAGGSRPGNDDVYVEEAYKLGRKIVKLGFKLDFGVSNSGIIVAVARGVLDLCNKKKRAGEDKSPIQGITTEAYYELYPKDDELICQIDNLIFAKTLEERKQKLLNADFVVFAPGGVGTLDELAYDCVAMQDGFLDFKPFIFYNIDGYFHHILEYLKEIALKGFADPMPFIVVDNSDEIGIALRLIKQRYTRKMNGKEAYAKVRELIYDLPYFIKKKTDDSIYVEDIDAEISRIRTSGTPEEKRELETAVEQAYLEKEIERMYERLAKTGRDTSVVSDKLTKLKNRRKK